MPCLIVGKLAGVVLLSLVVQSQSLTAAAGALSTTFEPTKAARAPPEIAAFAPSEDSDYPLLNVSSPAHPTFVLPEVAAPEAVAHAQHKGPRLAATAPVAAISAQPVVTAPEQPHFFSEIVRRCTFKPDARTVEGVCGSIETLRIVRSDPKKAFWAWVSKKKKYADEDWATEQLKVWNNGSSMSRDSRGYKTWLGERRTTLDREIKGHEKPIRAHFNPP
ncbi:hypothetical protein M885DRAFT_580706 [Pelagophyceae sp. CCMP2097]|nr:hypothetical protein M885DRAFT_580706 [Pelagophyceae sp. CCMP2097]